MIQNSLIFTDATSKTTVIVKFKGAIDIVITPVVLESAQRMFDSLTPTFQRLHPNSVVNHLHSQSLDRVESKNTLMKKEKSLDLQVSNTEWFHTSSLKLKKSNPPPTASALGLELFYLADFCMDYSYVQTNFIRIILSNPTSL